MKKTNYQKWLDSVQPATQEKYKTAWSVLIQFYEEVKGVKTTPEKLLKRLIADRKKPIEKQGEIEQDLNAWVKWLEKDYSIRDRGLKNGKTGVIGVSANTVKTYITAIRSFFSYYGFPLSKKAKLPRHIRLSNGKVENTKIEYRPEKIKKLLSVVKSHRDKAIILLMFQSGMDISTACSLNYGDVKEGLERGEEPLMVHVKRPKVGLNYRTFLGHDSIEAIKTYLNERRMKYSEKLEWETPLFTVEGAHVMKGTRIKPKNFQDNMREYVVLSGLVSKERMERADFSPARPHALRSGFSSIARLKGLNERLIDYFMGHSDPYGGAYNQTTNKELKEKYLEIEPALSVSSVSNFSDIEAKLRSDMERVTATNDALTSKVLQLEQDFKTMKELIQWEKKIKA
jgi:integrase/recombinase XerD